jgi:branched-chain amino acid aminotransferase
VGDYYKGGLNPVSALVLNHYDRSAPDGVGHVKVAGNYAADLEPHHLAEEQKYPINLYLDAREHRYVEEFGTSNFIAITKNNTYVTPKSKSILPSITNKTLMELASEDGMKVEHRPIEFNEIASFAEVGACGTAVVITPVNHIVRGDQIIRVGPEQGCGPVLQRLYNKVRGIQVGNLPDTHDWLQVVK